MSAPSLRACPSQPKKHIIVIIIAIVVEIRMICVATCNLVLQNKLPCGQKVCTVPLKCVKVRLAVSIYGYNI